MRGRKPNKFRLKARDETALRKLLRDGQTPIRIARRAQILLSRAKLQRQVEVLGETVGQDRTTIWRVCDRYRHWGLQAALYDAARPGRPRSFPRHARKKIERLACREPASVGWCVTHWSQRSLAQAVVEQEIVDDISHVTVGNILRQADLHLHRFRWWKTTIWDEEAVERALKILWYYERIESLWQKGEVLLAVDEKPNLQVLERAMPKQPLRMGQMERQKFTYHRHGTFNLLVGLTLYNGHMWTECLDKNDGEHFRPAMRRLLHPYGWAKRIHLLMDNGPSHTSGDTIEFFETLSPRVHVMFTPPNASWLDQAVSLLEAFSERYLTRGSWDYRAAMIQHVLDSAQEYNQSFAHPFDWQWSCRDFRYWLNNTPGLIRCKI